MGSIEKTVSVIHAMAAAMDENKKYLTKLDSEIGDGDHGNNMNRGFQAVLERLENTDAGTPADVLKAVSSALISKVGGAAGPLYGTAFLRAATSLGEEPDVSPEAAAGAIEAALGGVKQRGKAEPGDKTMIDALQPASEAAKEVASGGTSDGSVAEVFRAAADAAEQGVEDTVDLVARKGRASYLGERAVGHRDPGAASTHLLLDAAARVLEGSE